MKLFQKLPGTVIVSGKKYQVNTDFRLFVELENAVADDKVDTKRLLDKFYIGTLPNDLQAAVDVFLWFYRCGDDEEINEKSATYTNNRGYAFRQDVDALYQSFRSAYGMDLFDIDLHWWKFRKLMFGLPESTPFMRLVYWRTVDVSNMQKQERAQVMKMRRKYAIKLQGAAFESKEARDRSFIERLRRRKEAAT